MKYILPDVFIEKLTKLPETGMEYQIVKIKFPEKEIIVPVFNSSCFNHTDELDVNTIIDVELD